MSIHLHIVQGCFHSTTELNNCNTDSIAYKSQHFNDLVFDTKSLPAPTLELQYNAAQFYIIFC